MDRSQTRLLMVLSALVIAVATVLYLGKDREEPTDPDATAVVWSVDPTTATKVVVERTSGTLQLEKRGEDWFVLDPPDRSSASGLRDDRAEGEQVRDLLDTLKQVKLGIPVEGAAAHPQDFGLGDPPTARVKLTLADGTEHALEVGVEAPVGFRTYVRAADGAIVAVSGDLNRPLQAEVGRYRDHHVVRFDPAQVRDVRIAGPEGVLHVHGSGKDWFVEGFGRADPDRVDDLVVGLLDLRYDTLAEPDDPALGEVRFDVDLTMADGTVVGLQTGDEGPSGVQVAASDGRRGTVWPDALKQLGRGPSDVGMELVFGIHLDSADRVRVRAGGKTLEARRNGAAWQSDTTDDGATYDWVSALARTKVSWQREPPPPPQPVELTVEVTEGDRTWTVEVGPPLPDGFRSARDTAADAPVRIPADAVAEPLEALNAPPG